MTSLATMAAAVPMALGLGPGGEIRRPMALAVLGGVALSTILSLLVVPVVAWALGPLFFAAPGDAQYSATVLAAVPGMLTLLMLADRFDLDAPEAALFIGWSTIVFWLTLPVLLGLGIVR
jgi:predicted permease